MDLVLRTMPRPRAARPQDKHPAARRNPRPPKVPALELGQSGTAPPRTKVDLYGVRLSIPRVAIVGAAQPSMRRLGF